MTTPSPMGTRIEANEVLEKICCVHYVEIAAQEHKDVSLWFLCSGVAPRLARAACLLSLGWHELLGTTQSCWKITNASMACSVNHCFLGRFDHRSNIRACAI